MAGQRAPRHRSEKRRTEERVREGAAACVGDRRGALSTCVRARACVEGGEVVDATRRTTTLAGKAALRVVRTCASAARQSRAAACVSHTTRQRQERESVSFGPRRRLSCKTHETDKRVSRLLHKKESILRAALSREVLARWSARHLGRARV